MNSVNNGSGNNPNRKMDFGDEGRLKYGPIKRKAKSSRPSLDQVKALFYAHTPVTCILTQLLHILCLQCIKFLEVKKVYESYPKKATKRTYEVKSEFLNLVYGKF